jgi:hypothetical protein
MRVAMEPPKPEHETCRHCTSTGCQVYQARPEPCRTFECLWFASQRIMTHALPASMRPDRVGVVIDLNSAGTVIAHCERPDSWQREPMRKWLLHFAARTVVILESTDGGTVLAPDGTTERLHRVGVDPVTNNRLYVRASELDAYLDAVACRGGDQPLTAERPA